MSEAAANQKAEPTSGARELRPFESPPIARQLEPGKFNRFLATLPRHDFTLLASYLRKIPLEPGVILHDVGEQIERVYFPHSGMVSLVTVMRGGKMVETAIIGRAGVIGASAGLGARQTFTRAIVQLPGTAAWLRAARFQAAADESQAIRDLIVRYTDLLFAQVQQSVTCNTLHSLEARLCRWLLQAHDCVDGGAIPLTQEFLAQMLGVRRTGVTVAARPLQKAGLVRYHRGRIEILDRAALEDVACECYGILRQKVDKVFPASPQREPASAGELRRPGA
jgi:CRP-like cAMP-binding protein